MKRSYEDTTLSVEDTHWWYRGRRLILREILRSIPVPSPASVLEAGCGGGGNFVELSRIGSLVGLEPSQAALNAARRRGLADVVGGRIESMPFANGEFDVVTAFDVIEHTDDDVEALRELRRVVKEGGFLVVTVPAYPALWGPHDVVNEHRRRYVRRTLVGHAIRGGWSPKRVTYFNSILLPLAAARRLWERAMDGRREGFPSDFEATPAWLDGILGLPMRAEARMIGAGYDLPAGLSLLGVFSTAGTSDRTGGRDQAATAPVGTP